MCALYAIRFPGFCTKAVTFSYDEGARQDYRLSALFRRYGLTATFFLDSSTLDRVERLELDGFSVPCHRVRRHEMRDLYAPFEVATLPRRHGNLTAGHGDLTVLPDETLRREIREDRLALERLIRRPVTGFAYTGTAGDDRLAAILRDSGIRYARTRHSSYSLDPPENIWAWDPTCHDHDPRLPSLLEEFWQSDSSQLRVLSLWGRSFELDKDDTDRWGELDRLLATLAGHPAVWNPTNAELCAYITAARQLHAEGPCLTNRGDQTLCIQTEECRYALKPGKTISLSRQN